MATPKYLVRMDFNFDGDFTDADEDVTSDVRSTGLYSWKITRGQNLLQRRFDASMMEIYLNNDGAQKYSPYVAASPFNNALTNKSFFPAMNVWFMMGYPVDDFNASNGTLLTNRKPSHDDLFAAWEGDTANFDVQTNKIRATAANNSAVLDFGEVDCYVGVKFTRENSTSGLILRWIDASNYLLVRHDGTDLILSKLDAGSLSTLASTTMTWTAGDEKFILADLHGGEIRISVDDTLYIDHADEFNTGLVSGSTTAATKHGIGGRPADASSRWDDFGGWRSLFFGRIDTIQPRPEIHNQYAYVRAFDDMERMKIHQVYELAPTAPTEAGEIIGVILDAVDARGENDGFKENRVIDTGITLTKRAQHQKSMGRDGLTEVYQVQDDDVGLFYMDGSGFYRYEDSEHKARGFNSSNHSGGRHTEVVKEWRTNRAADDETDIYVEQHLEWDDGRELVENDIWYFFDKISDVTSGVEVWRLNDTVSILDDKPPIPATNADGTAGTFTVLAIGAGDVIASPITPVRTQDFLVDTLADGTGTDLTANCTATLEAGFEGNFRSVKITNNSGSSGFVTFLRLRGTIHNRSAKGGARGQDTASQTNNGRRRKEHTTLHIDEFDTAEGRAEKRINLRSIAREQVTVDMHNSTRANLMQQLHRSIGDRINFVYNSLSIENKFRIEKQVLTGRSGGRDILATWTMLEAFGTGWGAGNKWRAALSDTDSWTWA